VLLDDEEERPLAASPGAGAGSGVAWKLRLAEYSVNFSFAMPFSC
jgi:hypothetical protein